MPDPTSSEIAGRIEDLYAAPLADLVAHSQDQPPGMLSALLAMHDGVALAERRITVHCDRLAQLARPERQLVGSDVSHILDSARRLAEAVAVRDAQSKAVSAVLQSLQRIPEPPVLPARVPAIPASPAPPLPAVSAARSR